MSLAKLTSISTKTLSLLLERQRMQTLPSFNSSPSSPLQDSGSTTTSSGNSLHLPQIKKNLDQLRNGIEAMREKEGESEAVGLLSNQYERMRGMLGSDAGSVPSLRPSASSDSIPPSSSAAIPRSPLPSIGLSGSGSVSKQAAVLLGSSTSSHIRETSGSGVFAPYKDDPSSHSSPPHAPSSASHHFSTANNNSNSYGASSSPEAEDQDPNHLLQSQRYMMEEQDQRLDQLSHSVNRQHHLSVQINDELDVHHGLLEELDTGIDRTSARLGSARRRLDKVAKGIKENSSVFMIGVLIFVLLVLIIVLKT